MNRAESQPGCVLGWRPSRGGFSLIELIVASLIAAMIAGAVAASLGQALRARSAAEARQEALARATAAADRIALDALNLVRSGDLFDARVLLVDSQGADLAGQRDELLLFSNSPRQARPSSEQNEGGTYEVQYRLETPPDPAASGYILWRRADPVPDEVPDGGGIASPIVRGITALSIEAFDGKSWLPSWDSDRDGFPHALRITTLARSEGAKRTEFAARRTVAIDRVPIPFATVSGESQGAAR
ncbi:MAG: prepilin-type N-terminal cleavage/methylation domain-containing protein [Phycisphaerae bacterium]|nr:prepilin-type N-terminal cleavage/methylation domain-containing protein [Phycisphaerae bacterium]